MPFLKNGNHKFVSLAFPKPHESLKTFGVIFLTLYVLILHLVSPNRRDPQITAAKWLDRHCKI